MPRTFKELLAGKELVRVFAAGRIIHPAVFDVYGLVGGFHGVWLDQEHAGTTYEQIALCSVCARANNFDMFVRMAMTDYAQATQNLEAGAGGLMAARIISAEHAEEFMQWVKFAPRGTRGVNTGGRDALYAGKTPAQFVVDSNRDTFVAIQIETLGALEQADEIAAIDGVDMLFVGPSDLSQELGVLGQFHHEKLWTAYERVAKACERHGKHWATIAVDPKFAQRAVEVGCRMLSFGVDVAALRKGVEATKQAFGELFAE
jgi:4-hydroxy-2-oxoheptanedioate aldolase